MVVRSKEGRYRYIAFVVTPPVDKGRLTAALRTAGSGPIRLVQYNHGRGLVRCAHTEKDETIAFLRALHVGDARVRTVGVSGTIRKARRKYFAPRESERNLR